MRSSVENGFCRKQWAASGDAPPCAWGWSKQSSEVGENLKDRDLRAILLGTRGHAHTELGDWADAEACYREGAAIYREIGRTTIQPEPVAGLARLALARGDVAAAMSIIAEVIAHFDGGGSVDGTEDPLWIYLTCHQVLTAAAAPRAAEFLGPLTPAPTWRE